MSDNARNRIPGKLVFSIGSITLRFPLPPPNDGSLHLEISLENFWRIYEASQVLGLGRTMSLILMGATFHKKVIAEQVPDPSAAGDALLTTIAQIITESPSPKDQADLATDLTKDRDKRVLSFTYMLFQHKLINSYDQAAMIASHLLKQEYTEEAWRKRVERWAKAQGLPPVRRKRGRPPGSNLDK